MLRVCPLGHRDPPRDAFGPSGIVAGDVILEADGRPAVGVDLDELHELLVGDVGTVLDVVVEREGVPHALRVIRTMLAD